MVTQTDTATLQESQVEELSNVLARAFFDDPLTMYIMPDDEKRKNHTTVVLQEGRADLAPLR